MVRLSACLGLLFVSFVRFSYRLFLLFFISFL